MSTYPIDQNKRQQDYNHIESNIGFAANEVIGNRFNIGCNKYHINATGTQLVD